MSPSAREDQRIVGRAVHLPLEHLPRRARRRRAPRRGPAACSAARSCPAPVRSRGATRGWRSRRGEPAGSPRRRSRPGCGRAATTRASNAASEPRAASRDDGAGEIRDSREEERALEREPSDRHAHLHAVDQREALLRRERDGSELRPRASARAAAGIAPAPAARAPFADRARARGAPAAPDRPRRRRSPATGSTGSTSASSMREERSRPSTRGSRRSPFARALARRAIMARTARSSSGAPTPAEWLRTRLRCSVSSSAGRDRRRRRTSRIPS